MEFIDLAKKRCSVWNFQNKSVSESALNIILEGGNVSPTAANWQPNNFLVIRNTEDLKRLSNAAGIHNAPLAIVILANINTSWVRSYYKHNLVESDATIATDHMMKCAEAFDLAPCWVTYFNHKVLITAINIPVNFIPVNILLIVYSADIEKKFPDRHSQTRNPISLIIKYYSF